MPALVWDKTGERQYETGVDHGVLFVSKKADSGQAAGYNAGVPWNGLTTVTESPSGAESTPQYADNIKYVNLVSAEEFGGTIEALMYPDEFGICDGTAEIATGVKLGQQGRIPFALSYRTKLGNDTEGDTFGYKLHIIYNATAAPAEKAYASVNDSPEAISFSWEISTTPINVAGYKPTSTVTIDSTKVDPTKLAALEAKLYGAADGESTLLLPDEIATILAAKMMLDWLGETEKGVRLEKAVAAVIAEGQVRTYDMGGSASTLDMGEAIARKL